MSDAYYEDSIEDFDFHGAEYYEAERRDFTTTRHDVAARPFFDDYYEDIEPGQYMRKRKIV